MSARRWGRLPGCRCIEISVKATPVPPAVDRLARELEAFGARGRSLAIVCGSGLGAIASALTRAEEVPFDALDAMPRSSVAGHAGRFLLGELGGVGVLVQEGRVHLYEGRSPREVTRSVRAFARLGIPRLLLTNAAGALHADWAPGTLMRITDHLNLTGRAPLLSGEQRRALPYATEGAAALEAGARALGIRLERGVYAGVLGPCYETPAEIRMLERLGADAVGMSTVAEACAALALGLRVTALSLITNPAAGLASGALSHAEVVSAGEAHGERVAALLRVAVAGWAPS